MAETFIPVPGRLHNLAVNGYLAGANEIIGDSFGKTQEVINSDKADKTEVENSNGLAMCMTFASLSAVGTTTQITNLEWKCVLTAMKTKYYAVLKKMESPMSMLPLLR